MSPSQRTGKPPRPGATLGTDQPPSSRKTRTLSPHLSALARDEFTQALCRERRRGGANSHLGERLAWVEACWPLIREDYAV